MLAAILQQAGYKTGLYTSPHLKDFRERIKINGEKISKEFNAKIVKTKNQIQLNFCPPGREWKGGKCVIIGDKTVNPQAHFEFTCPCCNTKQTVGGGHNCCPKTPTPTTTTPTSTVGIAVNTRCPKDYTRLNGVCIPDVIINLPWLDINTMQIKYFEYTRDFTITDSALCNSLGVKQIVIAKGRYKVDYSNPNTGGEIRLPFTKAIEVGKFRLPLLNISYKGTNTKGEHCTGHRHSYFFVTQPEDEKNIQLFTVIPIIDKGQCKEIVIQYKKK